MPPLISRFSAVLGVAFVVMTGELRAQSPVVAASRCERVDTAASWYHRQADWWALDASHDWSDDSLRARLLRVASLVMPSSSAAFPIQFGASLVRNTNPTLVRDDDAMQQLSAARQLLRDMAQKRTWPLRSTVGPAGVRAAWLIASGDSVLTNTAMHRMMEAGPGEVSPTDVAVMEDWVRLNTGRKQIYASQLRITAGKGRQKLQPEPTEDISHVNLRRDAAALPPLAFALCYAGGATAH